MASDMEKLNVLLGQFRELSAAADLERRRVMLEAFREVTAGYYDPWDSMMRIASAVMLLAASFRGSVPLTAAERLLRAMESFMLVVEAEEKKYTIGPQTKVMADPKLADVVRRLYVHVANLRYDIPGHCNEAMPRFLAETNYQPPTSTKVTTFQKAFNTNLTYKEWIPTRPSYTRDPGSLMCLARTVLWVDSYPIEEKLGSIFTPSETTLMVDIGGGGGEQARAFRKRLPTLTGRIVVQDTPLAMVNLKHAPDISFAEHDLFGPQPILDAKLYYLRHVLQQWPDDDCVQILKNLILAMGPNSRLIIDDVVFPEMHVPWQAAYLDLILMNTTGGAFRTRAQWDALLERAGLKILDVTQYDWAEMQNIIVTVPK
ncbi:hypothetical protein N0V88_000617 [Collariella sp. IMI 366227]|nr:hypothetical protein N0V88_000617 [Collariella sp. IMI 366227]